MVTILPQSTSLANVLGMQAGQALQQGLQQAGQTQYQRGLLQEALGKVKDIAAPKQGQKTSPLDLSLAFLEATAGIPGAEKYVGTVLPMILNQAKLQGYFGTDQAAQGVPGAQSISSITGKPSELIPQVAQEPISQAQQQVALQQQVMAPISNLPKNVNEYTPLQLAAVTRPEMTQFYSGGLLPNPMSVEDKENYMSRLSNLLVGEPLQDIINFGRTEIERIDQQTQQKIKDWENAAIDRGIESDELPLFMRLSKKFRDAPTLTEGVDRSFRSFKAIKQTLDSFDKIILPKGPFARKYGEQKLLGGVVGELTYGSRTRDEVLDSIAKPVQNLVNIGLEDQARKKLVTLGLTPTEIEETIVPARNELKEKIYNFPSSKGMNEKKEIEMLTRFLEQNLSPNDSLLVIRDRLVNKGYDWKNFSPALNNFINKKGYQLSPRQQAEEISFREEPPRQSLAGIMKAGILDFLEGAK